MTKRTLIQSLIWAAAIIAAAVTMPDKEITEFVQFVLIAGWILTLALAGNARCADMLEPVFLRRKPGLGL